MLGDVTRWPSSALKSPSFAIKESFWVRGDVLDRIKPEIGYCFTNHSDGLLVFDVIDVLGGEGQRAFVTI